MNRHTLMKQLVVEEATKLRKHATKKELQNLDFKNLDSDSTQRCIYGQMTGNCFSERTRDLMNKSCKRVYKTSDWASIRESKINGELNENIIRNDFWSPIEVFIDQPRNKENGNNELLVKFLKGEINELNFK